VAACTAVAEHTLPAPVVDMPAPLVDIAVVEDIAAADGSFVVAWDILVADIPGSDTLDSDTPGFAAAADHHHHSSTFRHSPK
jgi:hypothetical protein